MCARMIPASPSPPMAVARCAVPPHSAVPGSSKLPELSVTELLRGALIASGLRRGNARNYGEGGR